MKRLYGVVFHSKNSQISSFSKTMQYFPLYSIDVFSSKEAAEQYRMSQSKSALIYDIEVDDKAAFYSNTSTSNLCIHCDQVKNINVVYVHDQKESLNFSQAIFSSEYENFDRKQAVIMAYHRVKNLKQYHRCRDAHATLLDHMDCIIYSVDALETAIREACANDDNDYNTKMYHGVHQVLNLVSDVLGLDPTGKPSGHPRITVAEYKKQIKQLSLHSSTTDIMVTLSYSMLAIALIAPGLALFGAISGGTALALTTVSSLAAFGLFSKAFYGEAGYRCTVMMKRMIDSKAQTVEEELREDFNVEVEPSSWILGCFSNL